MLDVREAGAGGSSRGGGDEGWLGREERAREETSRGAEARRSNVRCVGQGAPPGCTEGDVEQTVPSLALQ